MAERTATTANAILGLLALRPEWSTWDLTKQLRRNMRFFWPRAESQIYEEAKALVRRGAARGRRGYTGRRPKTTYAITPQGREDLRRWLSTAPKPTTLECEPLLRIFLGGLADQQDLLTAVRQVRSDGQAVRDVGAVVGREYLHGSAPFQDHVQWRALVFDFLSSYATMLTDWADRTEATISAWPAQSSDERTATALGRIQEVLSAYPPSAPAETTPSA